MGFNDGSWGLANQGSQPAPSGTNGTMFSPSTYRSNLANRLLGPYGNPFPNGNPQFAPPQNPQSRYDMGGMGGSVVRNFARQRDAARQAAFNPVANDAAYQASQRGMQPSQMTPQNAALLPYGMSR